MNVSAEQSQKNPGISRRGLKSEHFHSQMRKEHPEWNFCPTCNASLIENSQSGVLSLLLTHPQNRFVISVSLSPDAGTGFLTPFSLVGEMRFPVWAEPRQLGADSLAKERLFEETITQHVIPAFRNGFKIAKFTGNEGEFASFAEVFMKYMQRDMAEAAFRLTEKVQPGDELPDQRKLEPPSPHASEVSYSSIKLPDHVMFTSETLAINPIQNVAEDVPVTQKMVPTGVLGFDRISGGGIPRERLTLVSGRSGLGKTIFAVQFLIEGAKRKERGILALFDEDPLDLLEQLETLGIPLINSIQEGTIALVVHDPSKEYKTKSAQVQNARNESEFLQAISRVAKRTGAKRIVVDGLTGLVGGDNIQSVNKKLRNLTSALESTRCTTMLTGNVQSGRRSFTYYGVEERFVSGLVVLHMGSVGGRLVRYLSVPKMKGSDHNLEMYVFEIEPRVGVRVTEPLGEYVARRRLRPSRSIEEIPADLGARDPRFPFASDGFLDRVAPEAAALQKEPAIVARAPRSADSRPRPEVREARLAAKIQRREVAAESAKITSAAVENPWASILSTRDEESIGKEEAPLASK